MKRSSFLLVVPLSFLCGCARPNMFVVDAFLIGDGMERVSHGALAETAPPLQDEPESRVEVVRADQLMPVDLQPTADVTLAPPLFDLGAAAGAVSDVDLTWCKVDGLAPGYGHVAIGFSPDGTVEGVSAQLPASSAPAAHDCVEEAFLAVNVQPFAGEQPVYMQRGFYVK